MNAVIARTLTGKVRGSIQKGVNNHWFYAFKGIPYAKPPIGNLRFRDSEPIESWNDIREATSYGSPCTQIDYFDNRLKGSEDCLYLNVYTKDTKFKVGRPVMVWIHGGLFSFGSSDDWLYGPDYFMQKDVVFLTFNYRLNVFGFLNLDDEEASGNQGLKDQVLLLKWVQSNIANFGGDPNNVTICGISAGSSCAHYLAMSPLSKGLFHKAIFQSGVALHSWALDSNPQERAYNLCKALGYSKKDTKPMVAFLKNIDAQQLVIAQEKMRTKEDTLRCSNFFVPSVDCKSKEPFMPVHPEVTAIKGIQLPLMIGHTSRESNIQRKSLMEILENFDKKIDALIHRDQLMNINRLYNLTPESLRRIYFKNSSIAEDNLEALIDFHGEVNHHEPVHRVIKYEVEKSRSPTYFYQFSYNNKTSPTGKPHGAGHCQELPYLFKMQYFGDKLRKKKQESLVENRITEQMIELWVNFASTGTPTPKTSELIPLDWQPVNSKTSFLYLDIGENLRVDVMPSLEQKYTMHKNCRNKL